MAQFLRKEFLPHNNEAIGAGRPSIVAIHIIMERTNAKTLDCYVELDHVNTKLVIMDRYAQLMSYSRSPKIGPRHVSIELSDQGELMREIFPRAKSIAWGNVQGFPVKIYNNDPYSTGFQNFLTDEELRALIRYTRNPERVSGASCALDVDADNSQNPYGNKCTQRAYETMIMTVEKVSCSPFPL